VPSTPEALEAAFQNSKHYKTLEQERAAYLDGVNSDPAIQREFHDAVKDSKGRYVREKSPYTSSFFTQVRARES
jgi:ATP-binding cassette subfamily G (WHITE) protein 2 (SNQ2)